MRKLTSSFEEEYIAYFDERKKEIDAQIKIASEALAQAISLSEEYSIPFNPSNIYTDIDYRPNSYLPAYFARMWFAEKSNEMSEFLVKVKDDAGIDGWQLSSEKC